MNMMQKLKEIIRYMVREKIINDYLEYLKYQKNYSDYTIIRSIF